MMTCKHKSTIIENEAQIQFALKECKRKWKPNIAQVAKQFGVACTTLSHHVSRHKSRQETHEDTQIITCTEENELAQWITILSQTGFAPQHIKVQQMAEAICKHRTHFVNDESTEHIEYPPLGQDWVCNFLNCHLHLQTIVRKPIETSRMEGTTIDTLKPWFDMVCQEVLNNPEVDFENIYNMDELGFSIGTIKAGHVITNKHI
jgi:hypothetical protein